MVGAIKEVGFAGASQASYKIGDVRFGTVSPGVGYTSADGSELLTSAAPNFYAKTKLWGIKGLFATNADAQGAAAYTAAKGSLGTYLYANGGTVIYKKASLITDAQTTFVASTGGGGYLIGAAGGYVCKYDSSAGNFVAWAESNGAATGSISVSGFAGAVNHIEHTGTNFVVIGAGAGKISYCSTINGTYTAATGTNLSSYAWGRLFNVGGGVIYAQSTTQGVWAKSTNHGATWTVVASVTNAPEAAPVGYVGGDNEAIYSPSLGKFVGKTPAGLVTTVTDPTTSWTLGIDLTAIKTSYPTIVKFAEIPTTGGVFIWCSDGLAIIHTNGLMGITERATNILSSGTPWILIPMADGFIHTSNSRVRMVKGPSLAVSVPTISVNGQTAYIKVN